MSAEDVVKIIQAAMPFLTSMVGALGAWLGFGIKARIDHDAELRRISQELPMRRSDAIVKVMALAISFASDARVAAGQWSKYLSYHLSKVPDADDIRQDFFNQRDSLRRRLGEIVAAAEVYGRVPVGDGGEPHLSLRMLDWGDQLLVSMTSNKIDYSTHFDDQAEAILAELRALRDREEDNRLELATAKRPKFPKRK